LDKKLYPANIVKTETRYTHERVQHSLTFMADECLTKTHACDYDILTEITTTVLAYSWQKSRPTVII